MRDRPTEREKEREREINTFNLIYVIYSRSSSIVTNFSRVGASPRIQSKPGKESVNSMIVTMPPSTSRHVIPFHSDGE